MSEKFSALAETVGPGPDYSGTSIWLPRLYAEGAAEAAYVVEGRRFTDCVLEGPAVVLPIEGCQFNDCHFGDHEGDPRTLMLAPLGDQKVLGVIPFRNCVFERCRFVGVGFTGTPAFLTQMLEVMGGAGA